MRLKIYTIKAGEEQIPQNVRGIVRLARVLLWDAIYTKRIGKQTTQINNDEVWASLDDHDYIFSFVNVCHMLGLDPDAVRSRYILGKTRGNIRDRGEAVAYSQKTIMLRQKGKRYWRGKRRKKSSFTTLSR